MVEEASAPAVIAEYGSPHSNFSSAIDPCCHCDLIISPYLRDNHPIARTVEFQCLAKLTINRLRIACNLPIIAIARGILSIVVIKQPCPQNSCRVNLGVT